MEPEIHPNALKHLGRTEVIEAWSSVYASVMRESDDEPPRWLMLGWVGNVVAELIAVETVDGWLVIHAMAPAQKKFVREVDRAMRRKQ